MKIDDYGRVSVETTELFDLLYVRGDLRNIFVEPGPDFDRFNALCAANDKGSYFLQSLPALDRSPEEEHERRANTWLLPSEWQDFDVRAYVLSLCTSEQETQRAAMEMDLFEERGMLMALRLMAMLVEHFRANNIVRGVGRGSSVASFVLFKMGVHYIDSLKYNLDIKEFFR